MKYRIFCDGGARGNPGPAAAGCLIEGEAPSGWQEIARLRNYLGIATNNQAEYRAVLLALNFLNDNQAKLKPSSIEMILDSELVVRQLEGSYRVKHPELKPFVWQVRELMVQLGNVRFLNVRRAQNKVADQLVNEELDARAMNKRSFTLVEVLVVAGIIGVISSVAILNFSRIRARSRDHKRKADLLLVQTALELHFATNRTYPIPNPCGGSPVTPVGGVYYCSDPTNYVPTLAPQFIPVLPVDLAKGLVSEYAKSVSSYCGSQPAGGYFYATNGKDYKVGAACTVETPILAGDQFNDPNVLRAQGSFAVYSTGGKDF